MGNIRLEVQEVDSHSRPESSVLNIRAAKLSDSDLFYKLRNSREVRLCSFDSNYIDKKQHVIWFKKALESKNKLLLTIVDSRDCFSGYVRYDIDNLQAIVSIALTKGVRGKGYSATLLKKTIEYFLKLYPFINLVKACVKCDNVGSEKLFKKCGFYLNKKKKINEVLFYEYVYIRSGSERL